MKTEESYIWALIAKKFSGEASDAELAELEEILRAQPSWQYSYEILSEWWKHQGPEEYQEEAKQSFGRLKDKIGLTQIPTQSNSDEKQDTAYPWAGNSSKRKHKWALVSLILLALIGSGGYFFFQKYNINEIQHGATANRSLSEVSTRYGSKSKATLPDGTVVWLNAGSKLLYNNDDFGKVKREVSLAGEGFFDVAFDPDHPFIIHAGKIRIQVLGTSFDVKSYSDDNIAEATLIKGSIEVTLTDHPDKRILLKPNQKITVFNDSSRLSGEGTVKNDNQEPKEYKISPVTIAPSDSTIIETSWVENKLAFRSERFDALATQMERWYNVKFIFTDNEVKQYQFTGIFANESLDQALKALQITAPFKYKIEMNKVFISKP